jgi:hypothetical protein
MAGGASARLRQWGCAAALAVASVTVALPQAASALAEVEPNDTSTTATGPLPNGSTTTGVIGRAGDVDWYRIHVKGKTRNSLAATLEYDDAACGGPIDVAYTDLNEAPMARGTVPFDPGSSEVQFTLHQPQTVLLRVSASAPCAYSMRLYGPVLSQPREPESNPRASFSAGIELPFHESQIPVMDCPTAKLCVIGTFEGRLVSVRNPETLTYPGTADGTPGAFSAVTSTAMSISAVSCPTGAFCVATGTIRGRRGQAFALISRNPGADRPVWRRVPLPAAGLGGGKIGTYGSGVSCPTERVCVLVGGISGVPLVWATGTANAMRPRWRRWELDGAYSAPSVSCPTARLCALLGSKTVGHLRWPGTTSARLKSSRYAMGLAMVGPLRCPTERLCVGFSSFLSFSREFTTTDPAKGPAGWRAQRSPVMGASSVSASSLSCPTATFCLGGNDGSGRVILSTDPERVSSWVPFRPPSDTTSVACATRHACFAVGHSFARMYERPPPTPRAAARPSRRHHAPGW